ncbi:DUF5134 domain-containing protein [Arthrobacter sp. UYEF3]|uniref:DUF5134 domain-containing protein n=1 Tax=Arthrobacter sp. UYEF3 TaxID=1756365 RepID=UPI0033982125
MSRIDRGLQALMLHPLGAVTVLLPLVIFVLAAWWFVLRASSRRQASVPVDRLRTGGTGRGAMLYRALMMAATAYMLLAVATTGAHPAVASAEAGPAVFVAPHHGPVPR